MSIQSNLRRSFAGVAMLAALIFLSAAPASAAWISTGGNEGDPVGVRVLESSPDRVVLEYTVAGFDATPVTIGGQTYYTLALPGESNLLVAGMPGLPHVARSIIIPDAAHMSARVRDLEIAEFTDLTVVPSKGNLLRTIDPATVPYTFGPIYGTPAEFPVSRVETGEPYILRDYRGLVVDAFPITATGTGTVRVATRMVIEVTADGVDLTNSIVRSGPPAKVVRDFLEIYQHHFVNFGGERYTPVPERGRMLVITYDAFHAAMQPFVNWKLQSGIPTAIVDISTIGNNSTAIRNYIQADYDQGGLAFVLLVGDAAQIATPSAAGGASDPTYSLLAGGDRYPEILVGRFSAETVAQVQTQVERSVGYEQNPAAEAGWYSRGTGIGSDQGPGDDGEYDYQHQNVIRGRLLTYGYSLVDQIYDPNATAAMVTTALNNGRSIVNYTGHGSMTTWGTTGFSNSNVAALQNDWMLPFIFSVACVNGQFNAGTCFAEAWMRSVRGSNPIGAIGTYMSSINQTWNPPMCAQDECDEVLVNGEAFTFGALCYDGSCQMIDEYGASGGGDMFLTWHVFGDPSLLVRSKIPAAMNAQHDGSMIIGQAEYAVSVPGVVGARCALYGNGLLWGTAYTDAAGMANIVLEPAPEEPMQLTLTVVAPNMIPVIAPVELVPAAGSFLLYAGSLVDDAAGDADALCDAGESINLVVSLRNVGVDTATGVTAVLTSEDPMVEIEPATVIYGEIGPDQTVPGQTGWVLHLSSLCPDNHALALQIEATANEGTWTRSFSANVGAPLVASAGLTVDDSSEQGGNGTGWIDPAEPFRIELALANAGHANARNITVTVTDAGEYLTVTNGTATVAEIAAGGQADLTGLAFQLSAGCPVPSVLTVAATITGDFGYADALQIPIPVGGFADDVEMDRDWTCGAAGDNATSGAWVRADPVGAVYNGSVSQPEDDHTADPGTQCFVTANGSAGGAAGEADVDGGKTTLLSPVFDLTHVSSAQVHYWFWYTNNLGNNPGADYWTVQATSDGANWVNLERSTASPNAWTERTFQLGDYVAMSGQVQLRFIAEDLAPGTLVEAAVDDFTMVPGEAAAGIEAQTPAARYNLMPVAPNPVRGMATLRFAAPATARASVEVFDVSGRLVRTLLRGPVSDGEHLVTWDGRNGAGSHVGAGVYYVRMTAPGFTQVRTLTLLD